jgi:large subunit ribosomal protein L13
MADHIINAKSKTLGRLSTQIALILQGKIYPSYNPKFSGTDRVIVKNIQKLSVSGRKATQKVYYKHAGKLGHLKEKKYADVFEKDPEWILRHAVNLMLPKNKLQAKRMRRLVVEK